MILLKHAAKQSVLDARDHGTAKMTSDTGKHDTATVTSDPRNHERSEHNSAITLRPSGDQAITVEFGTSIDPEINDRVHALSRALQGHPVPGIRGLIPSFASLVVQYDLEKTSFEDLSLKIRTLVGEFQSEGSKKKRVHIIPCCYGSHFGPDFADLENYTHLPAEEIIRLHSQKDYRIYMLGFLPGFVYLGGLDPRLEMPRLSTPRVKIPRGAVGIGGNQTGVYPVESPGGWRLIGCTPVEFYDPERKPPFLCSAGEFIRFRPVTSTEFYDIRQEILKGLYQPEYEEEISCDDTPRTSKDKQQITNEICHLETDGSNERFRREASTWQLKCKIPVH